MKLQLSDNSVRIRITEQELSSLRAAVLVQQKTVFPDGQQWQYAVRSVPGNASKIRVDGTQLTLDIPQAELEDYIQRLPTRQGLVWSLAVSDQQTLEVRFDVDVRDSVQVRGAQPRGKGA